MTVLLEKLLHPTLIGAVFASNDVGRRLGTQGEFIERNVGPADFEQEIALRSRMCSGQPNCAHCLKIGVQTWSGLEVSTFSHYQKVRLKLDGKAHHEKRVSY